MIRHVVFALFIGFSVFGLYLAQYLGAFRSVKIGIENRPAMVFVSKEHFGAYHKIVPVINEVENWFKEKNLDCSLSFGEYLDNPQQVDEPRLRSRGGCIVKSNEVEKVINLPPELKLTKKSDQRYVIALFEGSPGIGPYKVYPKVENFIRDNQLKSAGPVIETYEIHSNQEMTTTYYFPIE